MSHYWNLFAFSLWESVLTEPLFAAATSTTITPRGTPEFYPQPTWNLFSTDLEYQYFSIFSDKIVAEICPYFDSEAWSRMLLQACTSEPAIRHAAVAISALSKTCEVTQGVVRREARWLNIDGMPRCIDDGVQLSPQEKSPEARAHHQYALEQYGAAIERMRTDIALGEQSLRVTLISCIIIVCFESLHGNHESATMQLHHGIRLMQDWKLRHRESSKHPLGFSSPAPAVVEDFLCQTFGRLEIQTMSFLDNRSPASHHELRVEGKKTIEKMPKRFSSIEEARIYLDLIMRRIMHFASSTPFKRSERASSPQPMQGAVHPQFEEDMPLEDSQCLISNRGIVLSYWIRSQWTQKANTWTAPPSYESPDRYLNFLSADDGASPHVADNRALLAERDSLMNELAAWERSFSPVLQSAMKKGGVDAISALTMHVHQQTSSLFRSAFFKSETQYEIFLPMWRTVVSECAKLLAIQEEWAGNSADRKPLGFAFDMGVVPSLYLAAIKCRDGPTRREALRLLRMYPRREGVWDSVIVAAVSSWVVALEGQLEEGADGFVPEEERVSMTNVSFDLVGRMAHMTCLQMDIETRRLMEKMHVYTW